eukprot:COSAG02_NODE_1056_length_14925_cov_84.064212_7_plen_105_part_00
MPFQVYDIPGQPLVCCNRTLAEHCVEFWPFLDSFFGTCMAVQEVNPFEEFNKNASAPLIFVLNNPAWIVWIGCVAASQPCIETLASVSMPVPVVATPTKSQLQY